MEQLTDHQKDILDFIRRAITEGLSAPSYREIQKHFGYKAVGTVQDHVRALIRKGYLEKSSKNRKARALTPKGFKPLNLASIYTKVLGTADVLSRYVNIPVNPIPLCQLLRAHPFEHAGSLDSFCNCPDEQRRQHDKPERASINPER